MQTIQRILEVVFTNENIFTAIALVVSTLWAYIKRQDFRDGKLAFEKQVAIEAIESGVTRTYHQFVKARKFANNDGKLTEDEKKQAVISTLNFAKDLAKQQGVELTSTMTEHYARVLIEATVERLKTGAALASENTLPV